MDPNQTWNTLLQAFATKQWIDARDAAEALVDWLEADGFPPHPTVGTTDGQLTCRLDDEFSRALVMAAACQVHQRAMQEILHAA